MNASSYTNYINARLENWYNNAKIDYDINGSAKAIYQAENDAIIIIYTEEGVTRKFEWSYASEFTAEQVFNIWAEQADETDEIVAA